MNSSSANSLLKEAREILDRVASAERAVRQAGQLKSGKLNLSFTAMAFYSPLPNLVLQYREHFPDVKVHLQQKSFDKTWADLERGKADLIFCEGPLDVQGSHSVEVSSNELGVYLSKQHPLAKRKRIQIAELIKPTFIFHPRSDAPHFYDSIRDFLDLHKVRYQIRVRKAGESCRHLVATEQGLLLATRNVGDSGILGIRFVPLEKPAPKVALHAVWKDEGKPEVLSFVSFLKESQSLDAPCPNCFMGLSQELTGNRSLL